MWGISDRAKLSSRIKDYIRRQRLVHVYKVYAYGDFTAQDKELQKVKVEISKCDYLDRYINKGFYGLTVLIMDPSCMFAHKLRALTDRRKLQNRDFHDAHFMFSK
jgi:hypothetical protein